MKLAEINDQLLGELETQIADAERQKVRLDNYIGGLQAYYHGTKIFLEMRSKLNDDDEPTSAIKNFLAAADSNSFYSPNHSQSSETGEEPENQISCDSKNASDFNVGTGGQSEDSTFQQTPVSTNPPPNLTGSLPNEAVGNSEESVPEPEGQPEIPDEEFQKLPQFEALKTVLKVSPKRLSVELIKKELFRRGFKPNAEFFDQSLASMLRYYEKKNVFQRDKQKRWGLASGEIVKPSQFPLDGELNNADCVYEILKSSGQPWLHVDQILVIMKQQYGYIRDKESVSSTLRKSAARNRRFRFFGGNRFGLLENSNDGLKQAGGIFLTKLAGNSIH